MDREDILYDITYAVKEYAKKCMDEIESYEGVKKIIEHYDEIIKYLEENLK